MPDYLKIAFMGLYESGIQQYLLSETFSHGENHALFYSKDKSTQKLFICAKINITLVSHIS